MLTLQNIVLEMIATGESLSAVAERLCLEAERLAPGALCSVLTVDRGDVLHPLAAPSLPQHYSDALDGIVAGPDIGSCGSAAYLGEAVAVENIATDPRWTAFRHLALPLGLRACWSTPVRDRRGRVIATFAFYYRECRGPSSIEREIVAACTHLCAIAIEHEAWREDHERRAFADALTGLPNRAAFDAVLSRLSCDVPGSWALLIVDLDNLKTVNDTFGHQAGDALLRAVAGLLKPVAAPDRMFRLGGDEFAILVQAPAALADLDAFADRLLAELDRPAECDGHLIVPRATIGGAVTSEGDRRADKVRQNADFALYHAKETGRGGFVRYWSGIGSRITRRLDAIRNVDAALREDRIDAFYQPIFRLDTREIVGFEALCRIRMDDVLLPAQSFHDATTDIHIATALTERMMSIVARDVRRWLEIGIPFQHVGINISSADFHGGKLCQQLKTTFGREQVPLSHVILEVTESVYMGRADQLVATAIQAIRSAGLRVALDDFGTGYASLTHLLSVPVDLIKIDKCFIDRMVDRNGRSIVEGLLHIARNLDLKVVAEGVEREDQAGGLWGIGCALGQGYLFSPAVDRDHATALLHAHAQQQRLAG